MRRACADAGRIKEAVEILDGDLSGRRGVNGFSYSSIMDALARQAGLAVDRMHGVLVVRGCVWLEVFSTRRRCCAVVFWCGIHSRVVYCRWC